MRAGAIRVGVLIALWLACFPAVALATETTCVPGPARPLLAQGAVVGSPFDLPVECAPGTSFVIVAVGDRSWIATTSLEVTPGVPGSSGEASRTFVVRGIEPRKGKSEVAIVAWNAFGAGLSTTLTVYDLGPRSGLPRTSRYCLVDRKTCYLYYVSHGAVKAVWPVAVGKHSAPTPTGTFKVGKAHHSGGPWGVKRRRLWRVHGHHTHRTNFFIHGTNEPWSIGTWASHGCVRMYNSGIRSFTKTVRSGTLVRIR